ncbi:MAG TPA: RNA polymerase sigma factor, partial [Gaiellaceae bacterium]|nr:RNA polymerase sigma factor [Gaiellaceae bacterium]
MTPRVETLRRRPGDRSFERLYRRHLPEVYRFVLRDVGNRADAEEVTQSAFLDAYRALRRGHAPEKPRAWLFGIAKNATRRRYRTLSRRPCEVELEHEVAESMADEERPHLDELRDVIGSLRPAHQQVLFLREIEGLSYVEIANRMDLSHAAVETLLFRARRSLRELLEAEGIRPAA